MFSVAPNILLAPNMTQNAERKHRTQDANTAHNRLQILRAQFVTSRLKKNNIKLWNRKSPWVSEDQSLGYLFLGKNFF